MARREGNRSAYLGEIGTAAKQVAKRALFPGIDLHARARYRVLPQFFLRGNVQTLDAGCGNGMLAYAAWRRGNCVVAVTNDDDEVRRNRRYYSAIGADDGRLRFETMNLYDLPALGGALFDQIICSETLEHVLDDRRVIEHFAVALRPGGVLHLCCPNAEHPDNALGEIGDAPENGGHVRDGYTLSSYEALLGPAGFRIQASRGLGGPATVAIDRVIRRLRHHHGDDAVASPPLSGRGNPRMLHHVDRPVAYSLYVQAVRAC